MLADADVRSTIHYQYAWSGSGTKDLAQKGLRYNRATDGTFILNLLYSCF